MDRALDSLFGKDLSGISGRSSWRIADGLTMSGDDEILPDIRYTQEFCT